MQNLIFIDNMCYISPITSKYPCISCIYALAAHIRRDQTPMKVMVIIFTGRRAWMVFCDPSNVGHTIVRVWRVSNYATLLNIKLRMTEVNAAKIPEYLCSHPQVMQCSI